MKKLNWHASDLRKRCSALKAEMPHPSPLDEQRKDERRETAARQDKWQRGERGYSTRGAQGHDAYARRNHAAPITLPKLKFLESPAPEGSGATTAGVTISNAPADADAEVNP